MRHIEVWEFEVNQGEMQAFTSAMQTWERLALAHENGPDQHTVLVDETNPCLIIAVTEFADTDTARAFQEDGSADSIAERAGAHCARAPSSREFSVYYAAGPGGPSTMFGQDA